MTASTAGGGEHVGQWVADGERAAAVAGAADADDTQYVVSYKGQAVRGPFRFASEAAVAACFVTVADATRLEVVAVTAGEGAKMVAARVTEGLRAGLTQGRM